ncbi:DAK2 domain-containing protein [Virgibacillus sp. W0181]|uniref:DAK2 domain-containing protein n=1 Tax=Virgibacillus sp. W0181 TaxID=3391581 RepID=UPI003F4687D0
MTKRMLDGQELIQMILLGAHHLSNNSKKIDALNVFPVPDGDTGTNMNLSMTSGVNEVKKADSNNVADVSQAFSKGLLMGARGNSGVILSQIFRGFAKGLEGKKAVNAKEFADAFESGVKTAYKAVMKPVEGTILTVAKDAASTASKVAKTETDLVQLMDKIVMEAKESLKRTPELLPVLKEVGVVDSGGQGLVTIYEGFLAVLKGEELPKEAMDTVEMESLVQAEHHKVAQDFMETADITYGYCTEFMVKFEEEKIDNNPFNENQFRNELSEHGDSLLVVSDEEVVKVHIHTEYPGNVMTLGQRYGSLINMDIENMREQHTSIVGDNHKKAQAPVEKANYGIVTIALGSGIKELFESIGATIVLEGGQTMNPSTQDIADAIKDAHAENVIVLPNNKNIVMAAEQAVDLAETNAVVVPTQSIPQGISALLAFHPDLNISDNKEEMEAAGKLVKTGQVTYAIRDTKIGDITIENGNFMGIADSEIKASDPDRMETMKLLLQDMIGEEDEILTVLYGEDVTAEELELLKKYVEETFEEIEIEIHHGNQPIYSYILSVE